MGTILLFILYLLPYSMTLDVDPIHISTSAVCLNGSYNCSEF